MAFSKFKFSYFFVIVAIISCTYSCSSCDPKKLSVDPAELTFQANESDAQMVNISTNDPPWVATPSGAWIHAIQDGATDILSVKVDPNSDTENSREGQITVTAGEAPTKIIKVTQARKDKLTISPTSLSFEWNETAEKKVAVSTNVSSWELPTNLPSWLNISKNGNELSIRPIESNNTEQEKTAVISITAGSANSAVLTVMHKPVPAPYLTVSTSSMNFSSSSQLNTFTINSNISWTVSRGTTTWITVSPSSGSNNGSVSVSVTANNTNSTRNGTITVAGSGITRTINVSQPPPQPQYAQVRFKKSVYSVHITQLAVYTTSGTRLASYDFGSSTGTSSYYNITPGTHSLRIYNYEWKALDNFTFIVGSKYTFELESISGDQATFSWYLDGLSSTSQQNDMIKQGIMNPSSRQIITVPIKINQ